MGVGVRIGTGVACGVLLVGSGVAVGAVGGVGVVDSWIGIRCCGAVT